MRFPTSEAVPQIETPADIVAAYPDEIVHWTGKGEKRRGIPLKVYAEHVDDCPADEEAIQDPERITRHFADKLMSVKALHPDHVYLATSDELQG